MRHYYSKIDGQEGGAFPIKYDKAGFQCMKDALKKNQEFNGIFWTVNSFKEFRRIKENVSSLDCFFVDIDKSTEEETWKVIKNGLPPSMIIKSKNGHHLYWNFACPMKPSEANISEYESILRHGIIPFYKGDKNVASIISLLRVPNFYHWKDRDNPFLITLLEKNKIVYTMGEFNISYPREDLAKELMKTKREFKKMDLKNASFWENACDLPCRESLERLSGHPGVKGDRFDFSNSTTGYQIHSNGKKTANWIDKNNLIGSYQKGGPTIANWINWYWNDWGKTADILLDVFPELKEEQIIIGGLDDSENRTKGIQEQTGSEGIYQ